MTVLKRLLQDCHFYCRCIIAGAKPAIIDPRAQLRITGIIRDEMSTGSSGAAAGAGAGTVLCCVFGIVAILIKQVK